MKKYLSEKNDFSKIMVVIITMALTLSISITCFISKELMGQK